MKKLSFHCMFVLQDVTVVHTFAHVLVIVFELDILWQHFIMCLQSFVVV
jgi:hypothetical protein